MEMADLQGIVRYERPEMLANVAARSDLFQDPFLQLYDLIKKIVLFGFGELAQLFNMVFRYDERMSRHEAGIAQDGETIFRLPEYFFATLFQNLAESAIHDYK
jgi:hypothetical protein